MSPLPIANRHLSLTLALLKPDITSMPFTLEEVRRTIIDNRFLVLRSNIIQKMTRAKAEAFYEEHHSRFFYNRLVTYMSSGSVHAHIIGLPSCTSNAVNAITSWRQLMGPTKVMKTRYTDPETIRGLFGLSDTRNCSHGSDSIKNARREMNFFFPEFDSDAFCGSLEEETFLQRYNEGTLRLDRVNFVHYL